MAVIGYDENLGLASSKKAIGYNVPIGSAIGENLAFGKSVAVGEPIKQAREATTWEKIKCVLGF